MTKEKNVNFEIIINVIKNISNDIYISGHKNADYDSMCSSLALALILKKINKNAKVFIEKKSISKVNDFKCSDLLIEEVTSNDYTFIALDLNRTSRFPDNIEEYFKSAKMTINIDHHNGNMTNADYIVSNPKKSSTCEMIYNLAKELNIEIDKQIAELLFTGIISDTNSFANSTSPETFLIASKLINMGIDGERIINKYYVQKTEEELNLISYMINNIKFNDFHYVVLDMKKELLKKIEYIDISKKCIPVIFSNQNIKMLVVIMDYGNKKKGEIRTKDNIDASKLATLLTGGGHTHAAGFANKKTIDEIVNISKEFLRSID